MGVNVFKSIASSYSDREYLRYYIERSDLQNIQKIIERKPQLLTTSITINTKSTPLHRAAFNGNLELVKLFIEKYKVDVNFKTQGGQTALLAAVKRNHIVVVNYLLKNGANPNFLSDCGLRIIDFAVLAGFYDIALKIYEHSENKILKTVQEYTQIGQTYQYRYVNYEIVVQSLKKMIQAENVKEFLKKQRKMYSDPVIDPRESWKQWIKRNLQFKDPPLIERSELPPEYWPQNRKFAKIRHFFTRLTISPLTQTPNFKPESKTQITESNNYINNKNTTISEEANSKLQIQSIS